MGIMIVSEVEWKKFFTVAGRVRWMWTSSVCPCRRSSEVDDGWMVAEDDFLIVGVIVGAHLLQRGGMVGAFYFWSAR